MHQNNSVRICTCQSRAESTVVVEVAGELYGLKPRVTVEHKPDLLIRAIVGAVVDQNRLPFVVRPKVEHLCQTMRQLAD